jgi:hypothetical protein
MLEYSYTAGTFEAIMRGTTTLPSSFDESWSKDLLMVGQKGAEDDNSAENYWSIQTPPVQGDAMAKRYVGPLFPSGAFTITDVLWAPGDFVGAGNGMYACEIRWEGAGNGTPDFTPAGLLGTFDPASTTPGLLYRAAAYDTAGAPGIVFTAPPATNMYSVYLYDWLEANGVNDVSVGTDSSGPNHKWSLGDSFWALGDGLGGTTVPMTFGSDNCVTRLTCAEPLHHDYNLPGNIKIGDRSTVKFSKVRR